MLASAEIDVSDEVEPGGGPGTAVRYALLADVHANLPALEAVLADLEDRGVTASYHLGDLVGYAPWPNRVVELLEERGIPRRTGTRRTGEGRAGGGPSTSASSTTWSGRRGPGGRPGERSVVVVGGAARPLAGQAHPG